MSDPKTNTPPAETPDKEPAKAPEKEPAKAAAPATAPAPAEKPERPGNSNVRGAPPKEPRDAPLYRVTKRPHFINGRIVEPDQQVRYAGVPGECLEPMDAAAKKARAAADAEREARRKAEEQRKAETAKLRKAMAGL